MGKIWQPPPYIFTPGFRSLLSFAWEGSSSGLMSSEELRLRVLARCLLEHQARPLLTCGEFSDQAPVRPPELSWKDEGTATYWEGGRAAKAFFRVWHDELKASWSLPEGHSGSDRGEDTSWESWARDRGEGVHDHGWRQKRRMLGGRSLLHHGQQLGREGRNGEAGFGSFACDRTPSSLSFKTLQQSWAKLPWS